MGRKCLNSPNKFCYICGNFTPERWKYPITNKIKDAYKHYFNISIINQDKSWAPHNYFRTIQEKNLKVF